MERSAWWLALLSGCAVASAAPTLFPSRVPLGPLLDKLTASGGAPGKVLSLRSEAELSGLKPGRKYKYVVDERGQIRVAPRPADEPGNEYVHPVLGNGQPVRTAGYLRYERRGATSTGEVVYLDQDSKAYCPTFGSLGEARAAFGRIGVGRDRVRFEDHPPACVALPDAGISSPSPLPSPAASPSPPPSEPPPSPPR